MKKRYCKYTVIFVLTDCKFILRSILLMCPLSLTHGDSPIPIFTKTENNQGRSDWIHNMLEMMQQL